MAFQEAITDDGYDQVVDVLDSQYRVVHQTVGLVGDGKGVAIASRWPLSEVREVDLHLTPRTAGFPCVTLLAEVLAPDPVGRLLFANHLPSFQLGFELERELQAAAAARAIEEFTSGREVHVVLAGDFDAVPDASSVRFWSGRQSLDGTSVCYRDAWESTHAEEKGHTFSPSNPLVGSSCSPLVVDGETAIELGRRIDYIFVRCGDHGPTLDVAACELAFDRPVDGVWASDHFGVIAELVVPAR